MDIDEVRQKAIPILRRARAQRAAVFGSVARGEKAHDVDMLVELPRPYGLFTFLSLKIDLEDALGKHVDLVEYSAMKPGVRERALRDAVSLV